MVARGQGGPLGCGLTRRGRARGFNLLEVVVATTLLAGVLFTVAILIPRCVLQMHSKAYMAQAVQLADQLMEQIRAADVGSIAPGDYVGTAATPPASFPPSPYPHQLVTFKSEGATVPMDYTFTVRVASQDLAPPAPVAASPVPFRMRSVTVAVNWQEPQPDGTTAARVYALDTLVGP